MREIILMIVWFAVQLASLHGQISISDFSYPSDQDTFYYKVDRLPENIDIASMGEERIWNFKSLRSPFLNTIMFLNYNSERYDVPLLENAKLMMLLNQKFQYILNEDNDGMKLMAGLNEHLLGANSKNHSYFEGESIFLKSSYSLGDSGQHEYNRVSEFYADDIPVELQNIFPQNIDQVKVIFETLVSYTIDDYGLLILPSVQDDVLRMKQESTTTVSYQYKIQGEWKEMTDVDSLNLFFEDYIQPKEEYYFFSENSELPLAKVSTSVSGEITDIEYQVDPSLELNVGTPREKSITAFPNPTFGETRFEFLNYPSGAYTIDIITTYGKTLWTETFDVEDNEPIKVDFSFLNKGTYLYSISNSDGRKLSIKRLVIITP